MAQCVGLGAGRRGDVQREGGGRGGGVGGGTAEERRQRRVCRAEGREELAEEFLPAGAVQQRGAPWRVEECHMPIRLNPNCVGGPGCGAAGRRLERYTAVVAVRSSKGVTRRGEWPAVAARMGGCVNSRHARSNCRA